MDEPWLQLDGDELPAELAAGQAAILARYWDDDASVRTNLEIIGHWLDRPPVVD